MNKNCDFSFKGEKQLAQARVGAAPGAGSKAVFLKGFHWLKHLMGQAGGALMTSIATLSSVSSPPESYIYPCMVL